MLQVSSKKREERRFNNVESGAKNCVFIKTTIQAFLFQIFIFGHYCTRYQVAYS